MENSPAIEVKDLAKTYGAIRALDGATLTVARGSVFGLVGPNGSGKTTLIKALCGVLDQDSGAVRVLGVDSRTDRFDLRRHLGYMPQTPSLYDDLSPVENLHFFGGAAGVEGLEERVRRALEFVQLWDRRDDPIHTFSGGMRQRASLACAMLNDPELLILDEPTAGVDPTLRQSFWDHFRGLSGMGRTIFISTNQMDEALRCDRVAVIIKGRILVTDTPGAIQERGRATITVSLAGGGELTRETVDYERELPRLLESLGPGQRAERVRVDHQSFEEVILSMIGEAG